MIDEIRRDNIAALVSEFGGVTQLAARLDRSESQVSQWLNGSAHSATKKPRGMRQDSARYIEQKCNKYPGWLDLSHDPANGGERIQSIYDQLSPDRKLAAEQALLGLLALDNHDRQIKDSGR